MDIRILDDALSFLERIPEEDAAKILAHLKSLQENRTEGLRIKSLKGKIREVVVKQYRIVFFFVGSTGYVVDAFMKKSQRTPRRVIERAEKIYKDTTR